MALRAVAFVSLAIICVAWASPVPETNEETKVPLPDIPAESDTAPKDLDTAGTFYASIGAYPVYGGYGGYYPYGGYGGYGGYGYGGLYGYGGYGYRPYGGYYGRYW